MIPTSSTVTTKAFIKSPNSWGNSCAGAPRIDRLEDELQFPIERTLWSEFCDKIDDETSNFFKWSCALLMGGIPCTVLIVISVMIGGTSYRYLLWYVGMSMLAVWFLCTLYFSRRYKKNMEERLRDHCDDLAEASGAGVSLGKAGGGIGCDLDYFVRISNDGGGRRTAPASLYGGDDEVSSNDLEVDVELM